VTDTPPCRLGELVCIGGQLQCVGNIDPSGTGETCNGLDDDCDGNADDLAPCPGETSCIDGECRVMCNPGEFPCSVGYTCVGGFCLPSECIDCADHEICVDNACVDPCEGVTCGPDEECSFGTCYDCRVNGCPDGLLCYERVCQPDRCETAGCEANQDCVDGVCQPACEDADCPAGQRCNASGQCAPDACAGVDCEGTEVCVGGECVDDPCTRICGEDEVCIADACVSDPCLVIDCAEGRTCVVDPVRGAMCVPPARGPIVEVLATGGGGCACNTSGRGSDPPWLLLLGLFFIRRRGRS
jgi:MYXO-CTERM domain-containing protein